MGRSLFTDEEIAGVAHQIAAQQGVDALNRDSVRAVLGQMARERGVEEYRGDTSRIWRITHTVKKELGSNGGPDAPTNDASAIPIPPALRRLVDELPEVVRRELAAVQGASEHRAQLVVEATSQAAEIRERELIARITELEAEVEASCNAVDSADASLEAAEARIQDLLARLERCEDERRELHGVHATQLEHAHSATLRAQEARERAEQVAQDALSSLRQLQGRSDAEREARERAEAEAAELRDRCAAVRAELAQVADERSALASECVALRSELATERRQPGQIQLAADARSASRRGQSARSASRPRADRRTGATPPT